MEEVGSSKKAKGASAATQQASPEPEMGFSPGPLGPLGILAARPKPSILPPLAVEKLDEIQKILTAAGVKVSRINIPIGTFEVVAFVNDVTNLCYILTYDSIDRTEGPIIRYGAQIMREVMSKVPTAKVVQMTMLFQEDFSNIAVMAANILDAISDRAAKTTTLIDWVGVVRGPDGKEIPGVTLVVTNRTPLVKSAIRTLSSHTIPARHEYGFAVYVCRFDQIPKTEDGSVDYSKMQLLGTCSGYTQFVLDNSRPEVKYFAVPTISEILSGVPDPGVTMIMQQIAMELWILKHNWLLEFQSFSERVRNPGRLIPDAEGNMCLISNVEQRNTFLKQFVHETPWLAMDYIEGRHRIPGSHAFADNSATLNHFISKFFGGINIPDVVQRVFHKTTGYISGLVDVQSESPWADARHVDYLHEAINIRTMKNIAFMLSPDVPPTVMNKYISDVYPGQYREIFPLKTILFKPQVMMELRDAFSKAGLDIAYPVDNENVDYLAQAGYLGDFGVMGTGGSPYSSMVPLTSRSTDPFAHGALKFS